MDRHQVSTAVMGQIPVSAAATRTSAGRNTASPSAAVRATCKFWEGTSDIKVEKILNEWKWKFHGGEKIFGTNSIQARGFYIYFDGFPLSINILLSPFAILRCNSGNFLYGSVLVVFLSMLAQLL